MKPEKKRILVLSYYYEPDLCAGSFRTKSIVKQMATEYPECDVHVVTTSPNRYSTFKPSGEDYERFRNVKVDRVEVGSHSGSMFSQAICFSKYAVGAFSKVNEQQYDVIYASTSRLYTGFLGAVISKFKGVPLYVDFRDILVETMDDVLTGFMKTFLSPFFKATEFFVVRAASGVNVNSPGFISYFEEKYGLIPDVNMNGVDDIFINQSVESGRGEKLRKKVVYAGNIGEGQGLDKILPPLANHFKEVDFVVIGDGGAKESLKNSCSCLDNVKVLPPIARKQLLLFYSQADVLFVSLNDMPAFTRVIPSKIFEYACFNSPILAGVSGFSLDFIKDKIPGSYVFETGDIAAAKKMMEGALSAGKYERKDFVEHYSRAKQSSSLIKCMFGVL